MNSRSLASRQAGFTLVELIIVILILGILSALALPRFINMGGDARAAKQQAIFGSVRAAAQITRGAALVRNAVGATGLVTVDGVAIATNYGYPQAAAAGIVAAAGLDTTSANADQVTLTADATSAGGHITIKINGAPGTCQIDYTSPSVADATPLITFTGSAGGGC